MSNKRLAMYTAVILPILVSVYGVAQPLPAVPVPVENPITEEKRVLGKILFWDEQLSSDNTVACGSCHAPTAAGADMRLALHPGADEIFGNADDVIGSPGVVRRDAGGIAVEDSVFGFGVQVTGRAAPNFFAGIWGLQQFWDGRAESVFLDPLDNSTAIATGGSLENQALGPILSDVEMAKEGRTWAEVVSKLNLATPLQFATNLPLDVQAVLATSPSYGDLFDSAFGDSAITPVRIAFAIATYERTLVADQTPFDLGDLTALQTQGLSLFMPPVGAAPPNCGSCHIPPLFTDQTFRNIGVRPPDEDMGRQAVTNLATDLGRFKVPSLRNIGSKTTFMHNGSLTALNEVIAFYAPGGQNSNVNIDPLMPVPVAPVQVAAVIDFLENGLSDPRVAAGDFPFDAPTLTAAGEGIAEQNVPVQGFALFWLAMGLIGVFITTRYRE